MTDWDLLQEWASTRSESAFAELLRRHLNLVYGSALRQVRDPELARDVAQAVFLLLSRKAAEIKPKVVLSGWLFRATGYAASRASRAEVRRRRRESEAIIMNSDIRGGQIEGHSENGTFEQVEIDSALSALPEIDRAAVITWFIEGQTLRAVGDRLGISEEAAKKRVTRALQKLRGLLAKRGTELTAAALGTMLLELRAQAAPAALENSIIHSALQDAFPSDVSRLAHEASAEMASVSTSPILAIAAGLVLFLGISIYCAGRFSSTPKTAQASVKQLRSVENIAGTELNETSPASKAAVPGKSLLVIAVRSAEANQPLAAHAHVSTWTEEDGPSNEELDADAQGIISIPVDGGKILSMSVWLSHPGRVPLQLGWEAHEFAVSILQQTVKMEQGRSLRGIVQNEEGKPVEGARITFQNPGSNLGSRENIGFRDSTSAVETDAQGRFHSDQIPVPVGGTAISYIVDHPDYVRSGEALIAVESLATNHIVVLHRGIKVRGRVVNNFGKPRGWSNDSRITKLFVAAQTI
jgi:RNA polymerase sigma factor (sigma-70 family)